VHSSGNYKDLSKGARRKEGEARGIKEGKDM